MALKPGLTATLSTRLSLTPTMRQGLTWLQLPTVDLITELRREADENPFLDVTNGVGFSTDEYGDSVQPVTLAQNLCQQISLMPIPAPLAALAQLLTGDLTPDGHLSSTDEDLAHYVDAPVSEVTRAIEVIQSCEPTGVGARDLSECLALQLQERGIDRHTATSLCQHLPLLAEERWSAVARATGMKQDTVIALAAILRNLNPRPGAMSPEPEQTQIAEILVEMESDGALRVSANANALPDVRMDETLMKQLGQNSEIAKKYKPRAQAVLQAYSFRSKTIARVSLVLVQHQHQFFSNGPSHMAPLTRVDLATVLGVHPSTVGRAVKGKALSFRGATYPLEAFLTRQLPTDDGGGVSSYAIQHAIRDLIEREDGDEPLSDSKIAEILHSQGVDIARRTVAKYRGCMKIPSSFERSRLKAVRRNRPASPGSGPSGTT